MERSVWRSSFARFVVVGGSNFVVSSAGFYAALLNALTLGASTLTVFALVDVARLPELAVWLPLTVLILLAHYLGMKHWAFQSRA